MTLKQADYKKLLQATNKKASSQKFVYVIQTPARQFEIIKLGTSPCAAHMQIEEKLKKKANVNENL